MRPWMQWKEDVAGGTTEDVAEGMMKAVTIRTLEEVGECKGWKDIRRCCQRYDRGGDQRDSCGVG